MIFSYYNTTSGISSPEQGKREEFSIFVGVGALMERGLKSGAEGIVPSVGNLIPDICRKLYDAARAGKWTEAEPEAARMSAVSALYQNGRTVGQSVAALKAAMACYNLCGADVLPPLNALPQSEIESIRKGMNQLGLMLPTKKEEAASEADRPHP